MAQYKYQKFLKEGQSDVYDKRYAPGSEAYNAGIYRCVACGHEIAIAKGHTLPPQNHHQHAPGLGPIEWQLIVYAQAKK
ncbi:hypothetical protein [Paraburkholderia sp. ZP32-5]|uniref:hypothetical protein n=1 Tax=Paraburkholderia sp. ZP32-5 TaxID=2883245 RepID=UPI001F1B2530|nr:hypothetical protein [Paraburkholderia sp. ZP32-5]